MKKSAIDTGIGYAVDNELESFRRQKIDGSVSWKDKLRVEFNLE